MQVSIKPYLALVALMVVSVGLYTSRPQTLAINTGQTAVFSNPYLLKDWASEDVYNATLQHVAYYLAANDVAGKQLTITDSPRYDSDGSLSFEFRTDQDPNVHTVTIETTNYGGGITTSAVSVDGDSAAYAPASQLYGASFSGFDSLTNYGLSATQVYEIQNALTDFSKDGRFSIDTTGARQSAATVATTSVSLLVNNHKYLLTAYSSQINAIHFVLLDSSNKQVFDSGNIVLSN